MRQYRRSRLGADKGGTGSADQLGGLQELYEDSGTDLEAKWEHAKQMEDHTAQDMDHTCHSGKDPDKKGKEGSPE